MSSQITAEDRIDHFHRFYLTLVSSLEQYDQHPIFISSTGKIPRGQGWQQEQFGMSFEDCANRLANISKDYFDSKHQHTHVYDNISVLIGPKTPNLAVIDLDGQKAVQWFEDTILGPVFGGDWSKLAYRDASGMPSKHVYFLVDYDFNGKDFFPNGVKSEFFHKQSYGGPVAPGSVRAFSDYKDKDLQKTVDGKPFDDFIYSWSDPGFIPEMPNEVIQIMSEMLTSKPDQSGQGNSSSDQRFVLSDWSRPAQIKPMQEKILTELKDWAAKTSDGRRKAMQDISWQFCRFLMSKQKGADMDERRKVHTELLTQANEVIGRPWAASEIVNDTTRVFSDHKQNNKQAEETAGINFIDFADEVRTAHHIYTDFDSEGSTKRIYVYEENRGIFRAVKEDYVISLINEHAKLNYGNNPKINSKFRDEVLKQIKLDTRFSFSEARQKLGRDYLVTPSGVLDVEAWALATYHNDKKAAVDCLYPHDPKYLATTTLSFTPKLGAKCDIFLSVLESLLPGSLGNQAHIRRLAGCTFTPGRLPKLKTAVHIYGDADSGKSLFGESLEHLFRGGYSDGHTNTYLVGNIGIQNFDYPQALYSLTPCIANIDYEGSRDKVPSENVKKFISGDRMDVRAMRENPFNHSFNCSLWVFANHQMKFNDTSAGMKNRFKVCAEAKPYTGIRDKFKINKIRDNETEGMFQWAMMGLAEDLLGIVIEYTPEEQEERDDNHSDNQYALFASQTMIRDLDTKCYTEAEIFQGFQKWIEATNPSARGRITSARGLMEQLNKLSLPDLVAGNCPGSEPKLQRRRTSDGRRIWIMTGVKFVPYVGCGDSIREMPRLVEIPLQKKEPHSIKTEQVKPSYDVSRGVSEQLDDPFDAILQATIHRDDPHHTKSKPIEEDEYDPNDAILDMFNNI